MNEYNTSDWNHCCTCQPDGTEHHRDCPVAADLASRQRLADYLGGRLTLGEFCEGQP